jgi:hypothetical protein
MTPNKCLIAVGFLVDTNCVNARQKIAAMNQLEAWAADEIIELITANTAQKEMVLGGSADRTRKAYRFIYTLSEISTPEEHEQLRKITSILCPAGVSTQNQRNDIDIVFNAGKYLRSLITKDGDSKSQPGGILGNRAQLAAVGINVLTPDQAVAKVEEKLRARDEHARQWAEYYNKDIPDWVGKD